MIVIITVLILAIKGCYDDSYHHTIMMMVVIIIITRVSLVLICVSKVTLDSIGNAKDATMRVFITGLILIIIVITVIIISH